MRTLFATLAALFVCAAPAQAQTTTQWQVHAAEGMDALLLIGAASGDLLQAEQYPEEIAWVRENFSAEGLAALERLDRVIRQENGGLVGPNFTLSFSAGPTNTLADVIATARDPEGRLRARFEATQYWDADDWARNLTLMPDLLTALLELQRIGFHERWASEWRPLIEEGVTRIRAAVEGHDVIPENSRLLGRQLDPTIEIVVLHLNKPYGIRVTGQRFLTHYSYNAEIQLRTATHELFHPPFDESDWRLLARVERLRNDPWMRAIVEDHDPRFGYNSFDGILNEDSTEALDQIVSERMGFAPHPPGERWREHDGGMHMMAAALYHAMHEDGFDRRGGDYQDWLISALDRGMLTPDEVRRRARAVVGDAAVDRWTPAP